LLSAAVGWVDSSPRHSIANKHCGNNVRVRFRNSQQRAGRTKRIAPAPLPVAQRLFTDADHRGELSASLTENPPNFTDIDRLELTPVSRARPLARPPLGECAREYEGISHRISALRPLSRLMEDIAFGLVPT